MKVGRPSDYSPEAALEICMRIMQGAGLREICASTNLPDVATVMRWLHYRTEFREQYAQAREVQAQLWADEIIAIADNESGDVNRDKLKVDSRKWIASKLLPKVYGDRLHVSGKVGLYKAIDTLDPIEARRLLELSDEELKTEVARLAAGDE